MNDIPYFYCCAKMALMVETEDYTIKEMEQILDIKYCPFCGYKLKMLH